MFYNRLPMKTVRDDFSGNEHSTEDNVKLAISFSDGENYYKAEIDASPQSVMDFVAKNMKTKVIPFGRYVKHLTDADKAKHNGKQGHYEPDAKTAMRALQTKIAIAQEAPTA